MVASMGVAKGLRLAHQLVGGDEVDEFAESVAFRFPVGLETTEGGEKGEGGFHERLLLNF
jgi:hypothetical protein